MAPGTRTSNQCGVEIPLTLLASYLFFLLRRPISSSNTHYLARRIRGLQSLAPMLDPDGRQHLAGLIGMLRRVTPANLSRMAGPLQLQLADAQRFLLRPPSFVVSHRRPPRWPLDSARRLLIIFGPAIGIGDEIILFPLPSAIRSKYPDVEIVVLSGYPGLWDRVAAVDRREYYESHAELVEALVGISMGDFDAVVFADFEKPGLTPAVCCEPSMRAYIEISLGAQCALFADTRSGRIHAISMPIEARTNYYEVSGWLVEWLGIPISASERFAASMARSRQDISGPFRIFVSPFTSKHEPSLFYWSRLIASLSRVTCGRPIEFVLDPGANFSTERFASSLLGAARSADSGSVRFRTLSDPGSRTLSLTGVFSELEHCDASLCADSFAAHAGPVSGCTTFVIARAGLEYWRVPFDRSFYFDSEQPVEEIQGAIGAIICQLAASGQAHAALAPAAKDLHDATFRLKEVLGNQNQAALGMLSSSYASFVTAYETLTENLTEGAFCPPGLLGDSNYRRRWTEIDPVQIREDSYEVLERMRVELSRWENTNLRKYLKLVSG